jgi:hypothetical protein
MYLDAMTNMNPVIVCILKAHIHNIVDTLHQVHTNYNYLAPAPERKSDTNHNCFSSLDH